MNQDSSRSHSIFTVTVEVAEDADLSVQQPSGAGTSGEHGPRKLF